MSTDTLTVNTVRRNSSSAANIEIHTPQLHDDPTIGNDSNTNNNPDSLTKNPLNSLNLTNTASTITAPSAFSNSELLDLNSPSIVTIRDYDQDDNNSNTNTNINSTTNNNSNNNTDTIVILNDTITINNMPITPITSAASAISSDLPIHKSIAHHARRASFDSRQLHFREYMKHQIPVLNQQISIGLFVVDRAAQFLKRFVLLQLEYSSKLHSIVLNEESKTEQIKSDAMNRHHRAVLGLQLVVTGIADREKQFADKVSELVINPMLAYIPSADLKRAKLVDIEHKVSINLSLKKAECDKLRLSTLKTWSELTAAKKSRDKELSKDGKASMKSLTKLARLIEQAKKEFSKYESIADSITKTVTDYRQKELPSILSALEELEHTRMELLRKSLATFTGLAKQYNIDRTNVSNEFERTIKELSALYDMNAAIDNWVQIHGLPPSELAAIQDLPCRSEDFNNNQWEEAGDRAIVPLHAQSVDAPKSSLSASSLSVKDDNSSLSGSGSGGSLASNSRQSLVNNGRSPNSAAQTLEQRQQQANIDESVRSNSGNNTINNNINQLTVNHNLNNNPNDSRSRDTSRLTSPLSKDNDDADDDDEREEDDDDTIASLREDKQIKEEWVLASVDHPPPGTAVSATVIADNNDNKTAADSSISTSTELPLLKFVSEDIIRVLKKDVDGDSSWWSGIVVGAHGPIGKFPASTVRTIDEQPVIVDAAEAEDERKKSLVDMIRGKVSKKKRRFQKDGFDLDLSYITPQIIAMGFPSESVSGLYRNNMKDVQKFLVKRHPGKFKIYNLCSERAYSADRFESIGGKCARYPFDDHNPSAFEVVLPFCKDVHDWLSKGPDQLAAIHCKAGKGRTGFLISCYLLFQGRFDDATTALRYYAVKRTKNAKGVTIPSQIRYTHYFARYLKLLKYHLPPLPAVNPVILTSIRMHGIPRIIKDKDIWFKLANINSNSKYSSKSKIKPEMRIAEDYIVFTSTNRTGIFSMDGDVQMIFYYGGTFDTNKMFQFWFNTRFLVPDYTANINSANTNNGENNIDNNNISITGSNGIITTTIQATIDSINQQQQQLNNQSDPDEDEDSRMLQLILPKSELDKACKDTKHKTYTDTFRMELVFQQV